MTSVRATQDKASGGGGGGATSEPQSADGSALRRSLKQMSYAEGEAALAPKDGPRGSEEAEDAHDHDHGAEAEPGDDVPADLDTERPIGGDVPRDIRDRIMAQLRMSPRIVAVLDDLAASGGLDFPMRWSARGNTHSNGVINLDRRNTIARWVPSMMHELNHLVDHRRGQNPSARTSADRTEFVRQKMDNEIRAHAIGYVGQLEQRGAVGAATLNPSTGFADFQAHLEALQEAESASFGSDRIQQEAETWLADQYRTNPAFATSNTGENYYDYWGRIWDEAHAGP